MKSIVLQTDVALCDTNCFASSAHMAVSNDLLQVEEYLASDYHLHIAHAVLKHANKK